MIDLEGVVKIHFVPVPLVAPVRTDLEAQVAGQLWR